MDVFFPWQDFSFKSSFFSQGKFFVTNHPPHSKKTKTNQQTTKKTNRNKKYHQKKGKTKTNKQTHTHTQKMQNIKDSFSKNATRCNGTSVFLS